MKRMLLLIPLLFLCGCWDYNEAAMQEYVLGVGIDLIEENRYRVTIETADLSGSPESPSQSKLLSTEGGNLFDAIRNAIPHAGKKLYWGHCALVVIDDAIQNENLHEILDVFLRAQDVYQTVAVTVARDVSAAEIFASDHSGSDSVTSHCLHIFQNQASSRRFQKCELWEYTQNEGRLGCVMLPCISTSNGMAQIDGGAVYREERFLGMLSGEEVLLLSLLTEETRGGWLPKFSVLPNASISTEILAGNIKDAAKTRSLTLTVAISSSDAAFDVADKSARDTVEQMIAQQLKRDGNALLKRAEREGFTQLFGSDIRQVDVTVRLRNSGMRASEGSI